MCILILLLLLALFGVADAPPAATDPRCVAADPATLAAIDPDLESGWMVQREDAPAVWYVASDLGDGETGLWIVTEAGNGIGVFSANGEARRMTSWPDARTFGLDGRHDAAQVALGCVG
jgi:hypothetical protein